MKSRILLVVVLVCTVILSLAATAIVAAQAENGHLLPDKQVQEATVQVTAEASNTVVEPGMIGAEGIDEGYIEVLGGSSSLRYQFSGVRDDGAKGTNGKVATALICSNPGGSTANGAYYIYSNSGTYVASIAFSILTGYTYTLTTQDTELYTENYAINTNSISQGIGQVYTDSTSLICSAQILDPTGYPPTFVTELELFR